MHGISGEKSFRFQREIELVISIFRVKKAREYHQTGARKWFDYPQERKDKYKRYEGAIVTSLVSLNTTRVTKK